MLTYVSEVEQSASSVSLYPGVVNPGELQECSDSPLLHYLDFVGLCTERSEGHTHSIHLGQHNQRK